jgi:hypothetical protein
MISIYSSGLNNGAVPISLPYPNCNNKHCMIHNFPYRYLTPYLISLNDTYSKIMSVPVINKINQSYQFKIIDTNNIDNSRNNKKLIDYVYFNKCIKSESRFKDIIPVYIDERYIVTNCVKIKILFDDLKNQLYETVVLDHKKFVYEILYVLYSVNCMNNSEIVINAFIIFLEYFIIDNLYQDIDIEWCKDKLNIIRTYTGTKEDLIKHLLNLMK